MESRATRASAWKKVLVVVKNMASSGLNKDLVGTTVSGGLFTIRQGDALAFALSVDDPNPAYFHKHNAVVCPFFASRILRDPLEQVLLHEKLGMNLLRMMHAEQSFRFLRPLAVGEEVHSTARIAGVRKVSSGELLDIEVVIYRGEDRVVEGVTTMFLKGKKKRNAKKQPPHSPMETDALDLVATFSIAPTQLKRYAAASGDYNPIHTNRLFSRIAGLRGPIAHGLCVMASTASKIVAAFGHGDPTTLESIKVRFARPVYPDEQLSVMVKKGTDPLQFLVLNSKGVPVLSNGEATFRPGFNTPRVV